MLIGRVAVCLFVCSLVNYALQEAADCVTTTTRTTATPVIVDSHPLAKLFKDPVHHPVHQQHEQVSSIIIIIIITRTDCLLNDVYLCFLYDVLCPWMTADE